MYFTFIFAASEQKSRFLKCVKVVFYKQFLMVPKFWGDVVSFLAYLCSYFHPDKSGNTYV